MTTLLTEKTVKVVKSTVPVLAIHGEAITKRFYQMLFEAHPELLNMFNQTHQKEGKQPQALANSIYAAAQHIDQLEAILPVVKKIAHKHRSLNVFPEHYPIVGNYLLLAIKEVLGDAATNEILDAWGEAYQVIADVFIGVEKEMYQEAENKHGGWAGFRSFVVTKKVVESDVITSFYLEPADQGELPDFHAGQYVSVKCKRHGDPFVHLRQYSLSALPNQKEFRISVKREDAKQDKPEGVVSSFLHHSVKEGDILELTSPAGNFTLEASSNKSIVLLSGGVGQTPFIGMLHQLASEESINDITYIHAAINGKHHAFKEEVAELTQRNEHIKAYYCYEQPNEGDAGLYQFKGLLNQSILKEIIQNPINKDYYLCGPVPFMKAVKKALVDMNVADENIHVEFFGPTMSV
ncbi:NO-inducible flavohemoprotein [Halalkalibacter urbisdiaboli]|uniref:NO-inducible flavohemoprotein n=1 Tax=Halalkalibacter urbisdiaboli TaxID=1960589 RepID=UPI000B44C43F|nr:NO-inducible flavohemoprotein [Halalkalibacter urbisdiaboli]